MQANGIIAIRSADLTRVHWERLLKSGFLQEVMKGWYIQRDAYMAALEEASVRQNIVPFAEFLAGLVEAGLEGEVTAKSPAG